MELTAPIHIHWELTNTCNLRCLHCYQQEDIIRQPPLDKESLFLIAKKIIDAKVFQVTLTGGEPFTVDCLEGLVEYFNDHGIIPHITSNGTILNTRIVNWLRKTRVSIQISLDSYNPKAHNYLRQSSDAYKLTIKTINSLHENGINVTLAFCANRYNRADIEGLIKLAIRNNVAVLIVGEVLPLYGDRHLQRSLSFSIMEYKNFIDSVIKLRKEFSSQITIHINSEWGFLFSQEIEHAPCTAMDRDIAVLYDGSVSPCPFIRHKKYSMGNLIEKDIKIIWKSRNAEQFRVYKHIGCDSSCYHYNHCMGGCKASLANKGLPISQRDPNCPLIPETSGETYDQRNQLSYSGISRT